jgi:hypothetical protein
MAFFFYGSKGNSAELRLNEKQIKTALKKKSVCFKKLTTEKGCTNKFEFIWSRKQQGFSSFTKM